MQDHEAREHLLAVLNERGIPLGSDDISWAFASPKTRDEIIAWVKEYLQEDTLITKDELDLYQGLPASARSKISSTLDASLPVVHDSELRAAIDSLRSSTLTIEKHSQVLHVQREALETLQRQKKVYSSHSGSGHHQQQHHYAQESGRLDFALEEAISSVNEELSSADKQTARAVSSLNALVSERLAADDQVLEAVSKLAVRAVPQDGEGIDANAVEQWSHALVSLREKATKTRFDAALQEYLWEIASSGRDAEAATDSTPAKEEIEAELKALRDEIGSVVELVVGHEFREPLLKTLKASQEQSKTSQHGWLEYVISTLEHLVNQLDTIKAHTTSLHSYRNAISSIRTAYNSSTDAQDDSQTASSSSPPRFQSRSRAPTFTAAGQRPPNSRSATSTNPPVNLPEQIFRRFDIPLPAGTPTAVRGREALLASSMTTHAKLVSQYSSASHSTLDVLSKSLDERKRATQTILNKLYACSEFTTIGLTDRELNASIQGLDRQIAEVVGKMNKIETR